MYLPRVDKDPVDSCWEDLGLKAQPEQMPALSDDGYITVELPMSPPTFGGRPYCSCNPSLENACSECGIVVFETEAAAQEGCYRMCAYFGMELHVGRVPNSHRFVVGTLRQVDRLWISRNSEGSSG